MHEKRKIKMTNMTYKFKELNYWTDLLPDRVPDEEHAKYALEYENLWKMDERALFTEWYPIKANICPECKQPIFWVILKHRDKKPGIDGCKDVVFHCHHCWYELDFVIV